MTIGLTRVLNKYTLNNYIFTLIDKGYINIEAKKQMNFNPGNLLALYSFHPGFQVPNQQSLARTVYHAAVLKN